MTQRYRVVVLANSYWLYTCVAALRLQRLAKPLTLRGLFDVAFSEAFHEQLAQATSLFQPYIYDFEGHIL